MREWRQTPTLAALRELLILSERAGPAVASPCISVCPAELARKLGVTTAAATGIVDRLEARGHAERRAHTTDGRRTEVSMTDSAREEVLGYLVPMFAALAEVDASFSAEELQVVERYLRGAMDAVRHPLTGRNCAG
jgi:DNA-binding MarR family transcriptional regulator